MVDRPAATRASGASLEERLTGRAPTSNLEQPKSRYAEIAVNSTFPSRQAFSYSVPDGLDLRAGHAV